MILVTFRTLDISEVRLKASVETSPDQRPQGKLGIWGPAVTTLGNISKMPVSFHQRRCSVLVFDNVILFSDMCFLKLVFSYKTSET